MHELSIVTHVAKTLDELAEENHLTKIGSVTLEIGEVSGIVDALLTDCWDWAVKKTEVLKDAKLLIETIPAVTFCEDCHAEYETVKYGKTCPECGSANTYLLQGNEFLIKEIAAE